MTEIKWQAGEKKWAVCDVNFERFWKFYFLDFTIKYVTFKHENLGRYEKRFDAS